MKTLSVKISKRNQIAVPAAARNQLKLVGGDRLIVDIQDGMILLIPEPANYTAYLAGLHHEIWERTETDHTLDQERQEWESSAPH